MNSAKHRADDYARKVVLERFPDLYERCFDFSPPVGWLPIVALFSSRVVGTKVRVAVVKQKLGQLRIYVAEPASESVRAAIEQAEKSASGTCEECSSSGTLRKIHYGHICVLCERCFEQEEHR